MTKMPTATNRINPPITVPTTSPTSAPGAKPLECIVCTGLDNDVVGDISGTPYGEGYDGSVVGGAGGLASYDGTVAGGGLASYDGTVAGVAGGLPSYGAEYNGTVGGYSEENSGT